MCLHVLGVGRESNSLEQIIEYTWNDYLKAGFEIQFVTGASLATTRVFLGFAFLQIRGTAQIIVAGCARDRYLELPVITFKFHWEQC